MQVTIIIPVYNRAHVLRRTLDSIVAQTYRPLQLVLVDNASTDHSWQLITRFAAEAPEGIDTVALQEPRAGACAARNTGFAAATGHWVLFFDSDDTMAPRHIERIVSAVSAAPAEPDMVNWGRQLVDTAGHSVVKPARPADAIANHLLHSTFATQAWAARRDFLAAAPLWDETLPAWNDYEFGLRLLLRDPRVVTLTGDTTVTVYSSGEASITGTGFASRAGYWEQVLDLLGAHIAASGRSDCRRLLRLLDFRRLTLAAQYRREGRSDLAAPLRRRALDALGYSAINRLTMPLLYRHIAAGRRGAAPLARLLIRQ